MWQMIRPSSYGQVRGDQGGLAVMCPGGAKPSGKVRPAQEGGRAHRPPLGLRACAFPWKVWNNHFYTCNDSTPAIYINPAVKGCADGLDMVNNSIDSGHTPRDSTPSHALLRLLSCPLRCSLWSAALLA